MHHVFVSYSRDDAAWVIELTRRLEAAGHETWLDQRDIPMTLPWFEEIGDAIAAADLFLICDSPASQQSANCGAETQLAFAAGKYGWQVEVGAELGVATASVEEALGRIGAGGRKRTELAVLARAWDRGGRSPSALVSARERRRLLANLPAEPALGTVEQDFVRASRSRARRRTLLATVVGVVIVISILTSVLMNAVRKKADEDTDIQAAAYRHTLTALANLGEDPYQGLGEAARLGADESAIDATVISGALETGVPEDGFRVPRGAARFATDEVGATVAVAGHGRLWGRLAGANGERQAHPLTTAPTTPHPASEPSRVRVQRIPGTSTVTVFRDGTLWRRITFSVPIAVLRLSPDQRELAAADGNAAQVADLQLGSVRTELGGARGPIRDLAWSSDGRKLWALGNRLVVSWSVRDGRVLFDDPSERIEALFPAASHSEAWTASQSGALRRFNVDDGAIHDVLRIPDQILSGAGSDDGSIAALGGNHGLWLVPLDGGAPHLIKVTDCTLARPTFLDDKTLFLPCQSGPLLRISVPRRQVVKRIRVSPTGVFAAKALPGSHVLLASDPYADLYSVSMGGQAKELFQAGCGGMITRIGASPDGRVIAPVGFGTGLSGCLQRGLLDGDDPSSPSNWTFDAVDDPVDSPLAEAAAVSRDDGLFAYGYADGTVVIHPTGEIMPTVKVTNVVGEIRDMYVTPADQLLVATAAGIVQRLPLCSACISNHSLAHLARERINRGVEIGSARRISAGAG